MSSAGYIIPYMKAELLFHRKNIERNGDIVEMLMWKVPPSKDRPHGLKYSLVYVHLCELEAPSSRRGVNAEFAGGRVLAGSHRLLPVGAPLRGKGRWAMIMPRAGEIIGITARKSNVIGLPMWIR